MAKKIKAEDYSQFNVSGYLDFLDPNKNPNLTEEFNQAFNNSNPDTANPAAPAVATPTVTGVFTRREKGGFIKTYERLSDGTNREIDSYQDRSAGEAVQQMFEMAGLGREFAASLMDSINSVYANSISPTSAEILSSVYNSDAYKTRFKANVDIQKRLSEGKGRAGDRMLTPKEYIDAEQTYATLLRDSGMPTGLLRFTGRFQFINQ
jgi:hypothetical protein